MSSTSAGESAPGGGLLEFEGLRRRFGSLRAPFAMPVLVGLSAVTWWQFAASAAISVVCTVGVARVATDVYRRAILRTGRRVRLREVFARTG